MPTIATSRLATIVVKWYCYLYPSLWDFWSDCSTCLMINKLFIIKTDKQTNFWSFNIYLSSKCLKGYWVWGSTFLFTHIYEADQLRISDSSSTVQLRASQVRIVCDIIPCFWDTSKGYKRFEGQSPTNLIDNVKRNVLLMQLHLASLKRKRIKMKFV